MSEYGSLIFLSQLSNSFEDESFDPDTCNICGGGESGCSCPHRRPQSASTNHHHQALAPSQKKPRGRPPGSKNKQKPPHVITQVNEEALKPVLIEVATGLDVVKALVNFACHRQVCISVLSGSGSIANVTLGHTLPHPPSFTFHGPFTLFTLTGTYIYDPSPPLSLVGATSSSVVLNPDHPFATCKNSFDISLFGPRGEIFGGVIDGNVVAGSTVTIMATVFKNPELHKGGGFSGNDEEGVGEKYHNPSASGGGGGGGTSCLVY